VSHAAAGGGALWIAGNQGIYEWNGSNWVPRGNPTFGSASSLLLDGADVFVTGRGFDGLDVVFRRNGSLWSVLGEAADWEIRRVYRHNGALFALGGFSAVGPQTMRGIAQWNGVQWQGLGPQGQGASGRVSELTIARGKVYAAGYFGVAGDVAAYHAAEWNGSNWSAFHGRVEGFYDVRALAADSNYLYAAGQFSRIGDVVTPNIARWNGAKWEAMPAGLSVVSDLIFYRGELHAADRRYGVRRWDGDNWQAVGDLAEGTMEHLVTLDGDLYAAGYFDIPTITGRHLARWDGTTWHGVGSPASGPGPPIYAMTAHQSKLYATTGSSVYQWDGTNWSVLPTHYEIDVGTRFQALASDGRYLYGGGRHYGFYTTHTSILRWDGTNWSKIGNIYGLSIHAMAVRDSELYVGGDFTELGGIPASHIGVFHIPQPLAFARAQNALRLSWPVAAHAYHVEQAPMALTTHWEPLGLTPQRTSNEFSVEIIPSGPPKFFRLRR